MKVALIRPFLRSGYESTYGITVPPLGLISLAGAVRDLSSVYVIDAEAMKLSPKAVSDIVEHINPDLVGFTTISSTYYNPARSIMRELRGRGVDALYVVGGHHATFTYPLALRDGFDVVVLGEGELTFRELVEVLRSGGKLSEVKGIAFVENGEIKTSYREPLSDLDKLPIPAYDLLVRDLYKAPIFGEDARVATLEFSRGCPYNCDFCSTSTMWGHVWRSKSHDRVIEELRLVERLGYNWVFFTDDNFIPPHRVEYAKGLMRRVVEEGLNKLNYIVQVRADVVARNPMLAKLMRDMGVRVAFIGVESGDSGVLRSMGKGLKLEDTIKAVYSLSRNGIVVHAGVVVGAPYESSKARRSSYRFIDMLMRYGLDSVQYSIYTPLPGSRAFINALEEKLLITDMWNYYTCLHPVMRVGGSLLKTFQVLLESRLENYLFYLKKWLGGKLGVLKRFEKKYVDRAYSYIVKNLGRYILGFILTPFTLAREYAEIVKSMRRVNWRDLILLKRVYMKHVLDYTKLYIKSVKPVQAVHSK